MKIDGHMIEVEYDGSTLRMRGTNAASRAALAGKEHASGDVLIPAADIASVKLKDASMLTNGNLVVRTVAGAKYQAHFRKKHAAGFAELVALLPVQP